MEEVARKAREFKPKMIVAGFSAYSRSLDWKRFREIADEVGAYLLADIAHIAGLVAGGVLENPIPYCDFVTTTTHKTLRGPRGALIMSQAKYEKELARAVFPGCQGGPHEHTIAAKAIAFGEILTPEFQEYSKQVVRNAQTLAAELIHHGARVITGGTDNHLFLVDVTVGYGISGKEAEVALEEAGISCNKNMIPYDTRKPMDPSGIRLGTPAITTRGMKEGEMKILAQIIHSVLSKHTDKAIIDAAKKQVADLCFAFPIYRNTAIWTQ